jgi:sulfur transfer complex TusBCD TusB component (DsrH family)
VKILHIIKKTNDTYAWQAASRQRRKEGNRVIILLLQDAVFSPIQDDMEVFACQDDVTARGVMTKASLVGYEEIVGMLLDADSVVCW